MSINSEKPFIPCKIAILTVSDTRSVKEDESGRILEERIKSSGHKLVAKELLKDNFDQIVSQLQDWINSKNIEVVITTGGTGLTSRDVTPEAFQIVCEKPIEGFGELFRWISYQKIGTSTIQSRATAGVANGTYLFAIPGSPSACKDAWDEILSFQLDYRNSPCNFVELFDRLKNQ